jgi:hypothetical protein
MVLPSKMGPVKGLKPGSRDGSDVRDRTSGDQCRRCCRSSLLAVVVIGISRGRCRYHHRPGLVLSSAVVGGRHWSWLLQSTAIMVVAVIGPHQHRLWSLSLSAVVIRVVVIVIDAVVPAS